MPQNVEQAVIDNGFWHIDTAVCEGGVNMFVETDIHLMTLHMITKTVSV